MKCVVLLNMLLWFSSYDYHDEKVDDEWHKLISTIMISGSVLLVAIWAYMPDRRMRDWAIREVNNTLSLVLFKVMKMIFIYFYFSGLSCFEREGNCRSRATFQRFCWSSKDSCKSSFRWRAEGGWSCDQHLRGCKVNF